MPIRTALLPGFAAVMWAFAPLPTTAQSVPMTADRWELQAEARFVEHDGRPAIRMGSGPGVPLKGGQAALNGVEFSTGVIEYDVQVGSHRDFVYLMFRADETDNAETFYIRPHQSGNPDATQYTPIVNGNLAWQIFTGEGFTSAVRYKPDQWMRVRLDVYRDSALVTIDGEPALAVPDLKSPSRTGSVAFIANAGAYISNFSLTPIADYENPVPPPAPAPLPAGAVAAWRVSPPMGKDEAMTRAAAGDWTGVEWNRIPVETHGVANLSLTGAREPEKQTAIARFTLNSDGARTATMRFGFSDAVRVFLNGRPLYEGADAQSSRDYRFLGIVGFWDTLFLPLQAGANEVVFVVTEPTNGGWAAAARVEPQSGVSIVE